MQDFTEVHVHNKQLQKAGHAARTHQDGRAVTQGMLKLLVFRQLLLLRGAWLAAILLLLLVALLVLDQVSHKLLRCLEACRLCCVSVQESRETFRSVMQLCHIKLQQRLQLLPAQGIPETQVA